MCRISMPAIVPSGGPAGPQRSSLTGVHIHTPCDVGTAAWCSCLGVCAWSPECHLGSGATSVFGVVDGYAL